MMGSEKANEVRLYVKGPDGELIPLEKAVYTNVDIEAMPEERQEPMKEFISVLGKGCEFTMDLDDEGVEKLKNSLASLSDPIPMDLARAFWALRDKLASYGYAIYAIFHKAKETEDEK